MSAGAYHGTWFYGLQNILRYNVLLESKARGLEGARKQVVRLLEPGSGPRVRLRGAAALAMCFAPPRHGHPHCMWEAAASSLPPGQHGRARVLDARQEAQGVQFTRLLADWERGRRASYHAGGGGAWGSRCLRHASGGHRELVRPHPIGVCEWLQDPVVGASLKF